MDLSGSYVFEFRNCKYEGAIYSKNPLFRYFSPEDPPVVPKFPLDNWYVRDGGRIIIKQNRCHKISIEYELQDLQLTDPVRIVRDVIFAPKNETITIDSQSAVFWREYTAWGLAATIPGYESTIYFLEISRDSSNQISIFNGRRKSGLIAFLIPYRSQDSVRCIVKSPLH